MHASMPCCHSVDSSSRFVHQCWQVSQCSADYDRRQVYQVLPIDHYGFQMRAGTHILCSHPGSIFRWKPLPGLANARLDTKVLENHVLLCLLTTRWSATEDYAQELPKLAGNDRCNTQLTRMQFHLLHDTPTSKLPLPRN